MMAGQQTPRSREQYEASWRSYTAEPLQDPEPHPDPVFVELCERAEQWGLQVYLGVKTGPALGGEDREFRHFDELSLRSTATSPPVIRAYVSYLGNGLHQAAERTLEKLQDAG